MTTNTRLFKTPGAELREKRNKSLCEEYKVLVKVEGQSKTQVVKHLMAKYKIFSTSTAYSILKEGGVL